MSLLFGQLFSISTSGVAEFVNACKGVGIEAPTILSQTVEKIADLRSRTVLPAPASWLDLTTDEAIAWVESAAVREHTGSNDASRGVHSSLSRFEEGALLELRRLILPQLDDMVETLRPEMEQAAIPLHHGAQTYGFSRETEPGTVLDMADENASAAFRAMRDALISSDGHSLKRLARFRTLMSRVFDVSPTAAEMDHVTQWATTPASAKVDHSVAFAAANNWGSSGEYYVSGSVGGIALDWAHMAVEGITLNTPSQVEAKLQERTEAVQRAFFGTRPPRDVDDIEPQPPFSPPDSGE